MRLAVALLVGGDLVHDAGDVLSAAPPVFFFFSHKFPVRSAYVQVERKVRWVCLLPGVQLLRETEVTTASRRTREVL